MSSQVVSKVKARGFYAKELAILEHRSPVFTRSKRKEIKKQNKDACKQARQRKKQYISTLEQQRNQLLQENQRLKAEIETLKNGNAQAKLSVPSEADQRTSMLISEYRELMMALKQQNKMSISRSLAVLRDKFGISGRERKKWMHQNLMRTIELAMPLHFRILIENVDDSYKFFDLLGGNEEMKNYRINFGQTEKNVLKEMKPKIKKAKDHFNRIFDKLHGAWTELTRYSQEAQKIIDSIEDNLDPVFVGNLLVNLDSKRCSSEQIRQIYPINFFKSIPEERDSISMHQVQSEIFIQSEDSYAFGVLFNQF